jgi:hypothetical protein
MTGAQHGTARLSTRVPPQGLDLVEARGGSPRSLRRWGSAPSRSTPGAARTASTRACYGERSHSIDAEEFYQLLDGVVIDDTQVFNDKLCEWENFYNYHRPTEHWAARRPVKDSSSEPRPR